MFFFYVPYIDSFAGIRLWLQFPYMSTMSRLVAKATFKKRVGKTELDPSQRTTGCSYARVNLKAPLLVLLRLHLTLYSLLHPVVLLHPSCLLTAVSTILLTPILFRKWFVWTSNMTWIGRDSKTFAIFLICQMGLGLWNQSRLIAVFSRTSSHFFNMFNSFSFSDQKKIVEEF